MRHTENTNKILEIFKKGHLYTGVELVALLPNMDKATIYRNIDKLLKEGLIKELNLKKGIASYELSSKVHQHLICSNCSKVYEIDIDLKEFAKAIKRNKNIKIDKVELTLTGKCKNC